MIRIENLIVKNFRNIEHANLNFRNFNVLVGPNNSGKSNFLQVISFLNFILNGSTDEVKNFFQTRHPRLKSEIIPNKFVRSTAAQQTDFEIKFSNETNQTVYTYKISIGYQREEKSFGFKIYIVNESLDFKEKSRTGPVTNIFKRIRTKVNYGTDISKTKILEEIPAYASVTRYLEIIPEKSNPYTEAIQCLNTLLKTPVYYFSNIELFQNERNRTYTDKLERIVSFDVLEEIIKLSENKFNILQTVLNDILKIEKIEILEFNLPSEAKQGKTEKQKLVFFRHFNSLKTFHKLSDGSVLLIALFTKILSTKHHIFFIEEPENSLHPKALIMLVNFMKSYTKENQFIIATHSLVLVNSVSPNETIICCIAEDGQSTLYNVANMKEMKRKLRDGYVDFSDYIFFESIDEPEFKTLK